MSPTVFYPTHGFRQMFALAVAVLCLSSPPLSVSAQQATGSVAGKVTDAQGAPVAGAQVTVAGSNRSAMTRPDGSFVLERVNAGSATVRVYMLGYRAQSAQITITSGAPASQDFQLVPDALALEQLVVTGTQAPRTNLEVPAAVTVLSAGDVERAAPRSTTEALRYVPGFTRVESSGGEVNQNISMRGILGVEYVMFMEDGVPVFPTMHTYFMNADNLFRLDENVQRIEVVRGGSSALFGSNTPGAIVNFINNPGGSERRGTMKATVGTSELARYDLNLNGPLGEDWRFNVGGFYRYDQGVRDPGFTGIRGGQFKGSITRLLPQGHVRASLKLIDDRNQFILPLPFQNPENPEYVRGFSDYGAMNTREGLDLSVPTPDGPLELPLDDGIRTRGYWLTGDAQFGFAGGWSIQNSLQVMGDEQAWNAILPFDVMTAQDYIVGLNLPANSNPRLVFTNHLNAQGGPLAFNTENGLVSPGGLWHVEKPLTAVQNQFQLRRDLGQHTLAFGLYVGRYTQTNHWYFTDILMDVRDQPRFLDLITGSGQGTPVTQDGFRKYVSNYVNGEGHTTVISPTIGGSFQLSSRLRADAGFRYEREEYDQRSENTEAVNLDNNTATLYDNITWGNGTFRHFNRTIDDWAASVALNYQVREDFAVYGLASQGYKMPPLDDFLNETALDRINLFGPSHVLSFEAGAKYTSSAFGLTVNGFVTNLRDVVSQGAVTDPGGNGTRWLVQPGAETRSYGAEVEVTARPSAGLDLLANATVINASYSLCPDPVDEEIPPPCPTGARVGTYLNGVPPVIGNFTATYTLPGNAKLLADLHYVHRRYSAFTLTGERNELPTYHYLNLGASYPIPVRGLSVSASLLNVYQSKGLEEGNPRLSLVGGRTSDLFLARPLLPRRLTGSVRYSF
jgi:outer membrane receptor protein involved in Fe transport